jgi:hypothetical protein
MNAARFRLVCAHYHIKSSLFLVVVVVALVLKFSVSIFRRPKRKRILFACEKKKAKFFSLKWSKRPAEKKKSDDADQTKDGEERERRSRAIVRVREFF